METLVIEEAVQLVVKAKEAENIAWSYKNKFSRVQVELQINNRLPLQTQQHSQVELILDKTALEN